MYIVTSVPFGNRSYSVLFIDVVQIFVNAFNKRNNRDNLIPVIFGIE